jgi:hypothetical protein
VQFASTSIASIIPLKPGHEHVHFTPWYSCTAQDQSCTELQGIHVAVSRKHAIGSSSHGFSHFKIRLLNFIGSHLVAELVEYQVWKQFHFVQKRFQKLTEFIEI